MTVLQELAEDLRVNERTLRRGVAEGMIRARRPSPRSIALDRGEAGYLRHHWPLLASLRGALRTERNVRLAVLIGSAARGGSSEDSDLDVLVRLSDHGWRAVSRLQERLERETGRSVDLVAVDAARRDPLLMQAALRDGRALVDRDGDWPVLLAEQRNVETAAARARAALRDEVHDLLADLTSG
jgi:predicted nucleotidyltransferase